MILITGASGNVGGEVLRQVAKTGAKVRAAFQSAAKAANAPIGVEIAIVDFNQPETLRAAVNGVDRVFLVGPPTADLTALERKAVDVFKTSGVQHLVKLSAMGGREATFPRQHVESEDYIRESDIPHTFLRPNGFMQNLVNYSATTMQTQNAFYGSEGDGRISMVDVRDVAAVAVKTLTDAGHEGKTYTLTGPEALTNHEVAQRLSKELGRTIRFVNLSPEQLRAALLAAGIPEWSADAMIDLQRLYREGKASTVTNDVEKILGRKPNTLAQFLRDYRQAFQARQQAVS